MRAFSSYVESPEFHNLYFLAEYVRHFCPLDLYLGKYHRRITGCLSSHSLIGCTLPASTSALLRSEEGLEGKELRLLLFFLSLHHFHWKWWPVDRVKVTPGREDAIGFPLLVSVFQTPLPSFYVSFGYWFDHRRCGLFRLCVPMHTHVDVTCTYSHFESCCYCGFILELKFMGHRAQNNHFPW